ncbi:hypothetical protein QE362_002983 [Klebsiella variicola]|nr:hypothetical protein [Klebsiella variicola]
MKTMLTGVETYDSLSPDQRGQLRRIMLCISDTTDKVAKLPDVSADDQRLLKKLKTDMLSTIEYAPIWIIMAVALALGIGTMIGWRRVATTIGEKIGKKGMTYAQGMSAQMTAAVSIGLASYTGMPVSTTHVLSSSVAGTMLVDGGGLAEKDRDQHPDGLGVDPSGSDYPFRRPLLALPETDLNVIRSKRVSLLARFFIPKMSLVPDHQRNQAHHHQTAQRAGQDKLTTDTFAATNKFIIVMVTVTLGVDIPDQPHLFAGLPMRGKKAAAINILIEQGIATT